MFRFFILTAFLAALTIGCSAPPLQQVAQQVTQKNNVLQQQNALVLSRYYPMKSGSKWVYALEQTQDGKDNTRFKTMHIQTYALPSGTSETPESDLVNQAIFQRSYPESTVQPRPSLARLFKDRLLLSHYEAPTVPEGQRLPFSGLNTRSTGFITALQLPLEKGSAWPGRTFQGGTETILVSDQETLRLPAGTFDTLRIEHHIRYDNGRQDTLRYWYAPDVGLVKMYEEVSLFLKEWTRFESTAVLETFSSAP